MSHLHLYYVSERRWGLTNEKEGYTFPSDAKIKKLWKKHFPNIGPIEIIFRKEGERLAVLLPAGTRKNQRKPFLEDLEKE